MPSSVKAVFLDLSGVLFEGDSAITGAADTVKQLRDRDLQLRFVTNTATQNQREIQGKLASMGIEVALDELFTAPLAAKHYIQSHDLKPLCIIHSAIDDDFKDINQESPNCVLLGDAGDRLTYTNLNKAFQLCKAGAPLIGIGMNKYYKTEEGLQIDGGAFIQAVAWASDTEPVVMGKPSKSFFELVVASTGFEAHECLMIGDDAVGDIGGATSAGLRAVLAKTGKYKPEDEAKLPAKATTIDNVTRVFDLL